jgi:hypothetical protein
MLKMKRLVLISLLLFPIFLFAQYPTFSNKQKLGVQTTGDGLIYRGNEQTPSYTPNNVNNAYFYLDTVRNTLKFYKTNQWFTIYPTASDTTSLGNYLLKSDTLAMLLPYLRKADTISLSNRINNKLSLADTASMLAPYLKLVDTTSMLAPYFRDSDTTMLNLNARFNSKLNVTDTVSLSNRINLKLNKTDTINLSNRIDLKLNKSDTISLSNRINIKLNPSDTVSLSNRINLKLDTLYVKYPSYSDVITNKDTIDISNVVLISDTASMLSKYVNTYGNQTNINGDKTFNNVITIDSATVTGKLLVNTTISDAVKITSNTNSTNLELMNSSGTVYIKSSNKNMILQTDTTALIYLNGDNKKVGILTMTPQQELEVNGNARITGLNNNLVPTNLVGSSNNNDLTNVHLGEGLSFTNDTLKVDLTIIDTAIAASSITLAGNVTGTGSTNSTVNTTISNGVVTNDMLAGSISDSKLNTITTVGKVNNTATTATESNTASTIVLRDVNKDFSARNITATNFYGLASTATIANSVKSSLTTGVINLATPSNSVQPTITVPDVNATMATTNLNQTFGGTQTFTNTITGNISGNAATVTSVTPSNFASQTANTILAAPNGSNGTPTFRSLVSTDIPNLNYLPLTGGILTGGLDINTENGSNSYQDSTLKVTYNQSSLGVSQNVTGIYSSVNTTGWTSTGLLSEASTIYTTAIGVKGKATQNDVNGLGVAYGIIGEASASGSGTNGSTYAGYFNNTSTVGGNNYGLYVSTASGGDYGIYQTGAGTNYFGSNSTFNGTLGVTGVTTLSNLAGSGTRMVTASSTGLLSTQSIPIGTVTGTGTTNYLPIFTGSSSLGNSSIYDNGNIGIGTNNPTVAIDLLKSTSSTSAKIRLSTEFASAIRTLTIGSGDGITWDIPGSTSQSPYIDVIGGDNSVGGGNFYIKTQGVEKFTVRQNGNIGINTLTPSFKLDVNGTFNASGNSLIGGTLGVTGATTLSNLSGGSTRMVVASTTGVLSTQAIPTGTLEGSGTTNYIPKFTGTSSLGTSGLFKDGNRFTYNEGTEQSFGWDFMGNTSNPFIGNNVKASTTFERVERMASTSLFNPAAIIFGFQRVNNSTGATSLGGINFMTTSGNLAGDINPITYSRMFIEPDGNIGIGTMQPSYKFDIRGTLGITGATTLSNILTINSGASNGLLLNGTSNQNIIVSTSSNLNSGIIFQNSTTGSNQATDGLSISYIGGTNIINREATKTFITTNNNSNQLVLDTDGNVGIGVEDATAKLDVSGTLKVSGTTTLSNLGTNGTRMVVTDNNGLLSTQAIPSSVEPNLYLALNGPTIVLATSMGSQSTYFLHIDNVNTVTVTLPTASLNTNKSITIKNGGSGAVNSNAENVQRLTGSTSNIILLSGGGKFATLVSDGFNWITMAAN